MLTTKFKKDDIVIFHLNTCTEPAIWRKGIIVDNNFPMMNDPGEFHPEYYIAELDIDEDHYIGNNSARYFAVPADDNNIEYWTEYIEDFWMRKVEPDDMEYLKRCNETKSYPYWKDEKIFNIEEGLIDCTSAYTEETAMVDKQRWKNQFKNVTLEDYAEIPAIKEMIEKENQWKKLVELKLNQIIDKLNYLMGIWPQIWTDPYQRPFEPYYKPEKYDPERWKIYCETKTTNRTDNLNADIKPEEEYMYKEMFSGCDPKKWQSEQNDSISTTLTDMFDYAKYNHMSTCTDANINTEYIQHTKK